MQENFRTKDLAVGYNGNILIQGINITLTPGKILTLIGPNGAGKSTILKTITRQLKSISGNIFIGSQELSRFSGNALARNMAVVLTERVHPELMNCAEVVAMGRYPYTDMFGKLSSHDQAVAYEALKSVHALDLADHDFSTLSDGQKQRIMLARAICQEPEIIVLDEPTAYLDIRYKIELLDILRDMARAKGTIVIMSLHEVDLAIKISDELLCLHGNSVQAYGPTENILSEHIIEDLYEIRSGTYNLLFGSVELPKPTGSPKVFVVAGSGCGTPLYRELQKRSIPFATGILFENDVDCQTADALGSCVIKAPAFEPISAETAADAEKVLLQCDCVLDAGTPIGSLNRENEELLRIADERQIPIFHHPNEIPGA